ncbi:hypothetical protein LTR53_013153 [Teratosphaeriaceae sp. CCFEE 6253]|nr:hypothetical protein LTR53_013153 [Teratosphaeriaceae sp. CCFEE 6253]
MASARPTVLLVHGAWHTPSHLSALSKHLRNAGYEVVAPRLPSCNLDADPGDAMAEDANVIAAAIQSTTDAGKDVVLFGHSYGGTVASEGLALYLSSLEGAAPAEPAQGKIVRLVFLTALLLNQGQSAAAQNILSAADPSMPPPQISPEGILLPPRPDDKVAREMTIARLYNATPPALAEEALDGMTGYALSAYRQPTKYQGWSVAGVPATYILCGNDQAWPPVQQRQCIERMKMAGMEVEVVEREGWDHSPYLGHAAEVAQIVRDAVESQAG